MAKKADIQAQMEESINLMKQLNGIHEKYAKDAVNQEGQVSELLEIQANKLRMINELKANYNYLSADQKKTLNDLNNEYVKEYDELKKINNQLKEQSKNQDAINKKVQKYSEALAKGWEFLMASDKVIKETIRNLGMSGAKAESMRKSFELSAQHVARMGGTLETIQSVMQGYAEETGRARALTGSMVEDITAIGLGTGIGIEQAAKLGAQFELMGFDARSTMEYVQGIVETSELMGVNTTKVLKNMNDNFKKVNTYSFKAGAKGIADMAMNAEKMKVDMKAALSAADAAKGLENAIELAANLQVMGGEFAKTDPFEWMYLARNEPEKLTEKISEMTRGIVSFRKMSDGSFEKFISPADRQRLEQVAKSLGISNEEMTEIAQRRADIDKMDKDLGGKGLTKKQRDLIQGAAIFDKKSGKFQVELAGRMQDISTLTEAQANSFEQESVSLQKRAELAMDFETAFKATMLELKASLLPMLKGINVVLAGFRKVMQPISDAIAAMTKSDLGTKILKGAGMLMAAGFLFNKVLLGFTSKGLSERIAGKIGGGTAKTSGFSVRNLFRKKAPAVTNVGNTGGAVNPNAGAASANQKWWQTKTGGIKKGAPALMKAQGMKNLATGAGVGAAAVGVGAGIGVAAVGIGKLAQAIKDVDIEKLKVMNKTIAILGTTMVAILVPAMFALATAGTAAAPALAAIGLAAVGIGAGIGIAAAGIGYMAEGLSKLVGSSKGAGWELLQIGIGIAAINAAMATTGVFGAIGGFFGGFKTLSKTMKIISENAVGVHYVGEAFKNIGTALANAGDFAKFNKAIESMSNINVSGEGFVNLSKTMKLVSDNAAGVHKAGEGFKNISAALVNSANFTVIKNAIESISKINLSAGGFGTLTNMMKSVSDNAAGLHKAGEGFRNISAALVNSANFTMVKEAIESISKVNLSGGGFGTLTNVMKSISDNASGVYRAGEGFKNISAALVGNADDYTAIKDAVQSISKVNLSGGGMLADLARLLKSPLKVEFADSTVKMTNDITLNIDGKRFMNTAYDVNLAIQKHVMAKNGTGGHV